MNIYSTLYYVVIIALKKRERLGIISLILEASSTEAHNTRKTLKIMYDTLLNHPRLKEYWTAMTEVGLLEYEISTQTFKTTEKGHRFLEVFSELDQRVREEHNNNNNSSGLGVNM
jgi:predicted transcriptional regulator